MTEPPLVWDGVLRRLGTVLPGYVLESWLRPLAVVQEPGSLRLLCPTAFHRDWIRDRYLDALADIVAALSGGQLAVELEVASDHAPAGPRCAVDAPARPHARRPEPSHVAAVGERASRAAVPARSRAPFQESLPYSFDSFVTGPCNALAREAALVVARGDAQHIAPLFLASTAGLGKTHLSRAIVREVRSQTGQRAVYASAEAFTSHFQSALAHKRMDHFKQRLRSGCDLFVIEDIQFLKSKPATQLELFHTVAHLLDAGARVVATADRAPRDLAEFDPRLVSQLAAGLVAELEPPDASVRRSILRSTAASGGVHLPDACLERLVESVRGSVRDLVAVLRQLVATSALLKRPIDLELTERALRKLPSGESLTPRLDPEQVLGAVCSFFGTTRESLAARTRRRDVLVPRQIAMYLCRRYTHASVAEIAELFGRDHPSVRNAERVVEQAILERAPIRYKVEEISARLEGSTRRRRR
jgi:chromosomal replication initiator protein